VGRRRRKNRKERDEREMERKCMAGKKRRI